MKTLNQQVREYTDYLKQGDLQRAYRGILMFVGRLRADFIKKYPDDEVGSIYQGYLDLSCFSVKPREVRVKDLKIIIAYLHEKGNFEVWLSGRNRQITKRYQAVFSNGLPDLKQVFHDEHNQEAIIEQTLVYTPDFEDPIVLMELIQEGYEKFLESIIPFL